MASSTSIYTNLYWVIAFVFFAGGWCHPGDDKIYVAILLLLPLIFQVVSTFLFYKNKPSNDNKSNPTDHKFEGHKDPVRWSSLSFTFIYMVFWIVYSKCVKLTSFWNNTLAFLCLSIASFAVFLSFIIGYVILEPKKYNHWVFDAIDDVTKRSSFGTLCNFISIFLSVTYLISFSLAFHDRSTSTSYQADNSLKYEVALYRDPTKVNKHILPSNVEKGNNHESQDKITSLIGFMNKEPAFNMYFDDGSANLTWRQEEVLNVIRDNDTIRTGKDCLSHGSNGDMQNYCKRVIEEKINTILGCLIMKHGYEKVSTVDKQKNAEMMLNVIFRINMLSQLKPYQRIHIEIIGNCSKTAPIKDKSPYKTNYELAQARISELQRVITEILGRDGDGNINNIKFTNSSNGRNFPNIEWTTQAKSSEECFNTSTPAEPKDYQRVDVRIYAVENHITEMSNTSLASLEDMNKPKQLKPDELDLMDYIYFTIYTITTTGYGDIVPITPLSKFIVSITNYFELFFIVIFFNALISAKREPKSESAPPS